MSLRKWNLRLSLEWESENIDKVHLSKWKYVSIWKCLSRKIFKSKMNFFFSDIILVKMPNLTATLFDFALFAIGFLDKEDLLFLAAILNLRDD